MKRAFAPKGKGQMVKQRGAKPGKAFVQTAGEKGRTPPSKCGAKVTQRGNPPKG